MTQYNTVKKIKYWYKDKIGKKLRAAKKGISFIYKYRSFIYKYRWRKKYLII